MEEYTQLTLDDWLAMKESLKRDLIGVQESFVRIGYTLRKIEEQKLYKNDGYETVTEFAKAEYGLSASTISRFMSINRKFSIDGYSDRLRPEYAQMGSSKLSEMLSLPDVDMEMIRPEMPKADIRELKHFNKEMPEPEVADSLEKLVWKFFEANVAIAKELEQSEAYARTAKRRKWLRSSTRRESKRSAPGCTIWRCTRMTSRLSSLGSSHRK